jgi:hypothetical protein
MFSCNIYIIYIFIYIIIYFSDETLGMIKEFYTFYWLIGGIVYIFGCLLYVWRFPERYFPGKFDILVYIILFIIYSI